MFHSEIIKFEEKLYVVRKKIPVHLSPNIEICKEIFRADVVLKRGELFYFVESIPDLEIEPDVLEVSVS